MSTTGGIGGERTVLAAATWTSLATEVASLGNNVRIITPLTDVRAVLAADGVTPSGGSTGVAVTANHAMSVVIQKGITDVLWVYSVVGGNVYLQNNDTNDLLMVDSVTDALIADVLTAATVGDVGNVDFNWRANTDNEVGVAGTGITAEHLTTDGHNFVTKLTVAGVMPAIAGGANLGVGLLAFTFPAGVHLLKVARISLSLQQTTAKVTADQPEISLGSVIVVGAVATMTTGTWEDILTAQVMDDCDGTVEEKTILVPTAGHLVSEAGAVKKVHINIADGWATDGDPALGVTGEIWFEWTRFSS